MYYSSLTFSVYVLFFASISELQKLWWKTLLDIPARRFKWFPIDFSWTTETLIEDGFGDAWMLLQGVSDRHFRNFKTLMDDGFGDARILLQAVSDRIFMNYGNFDGRRFWRCLNVASRGLRQTFMNYRNFDGRRFWRCRKVSSSGFWPTFHELQ